MKNTKIHENSKLNPKLMSKKFQKIPKNSTKIHQKTISQIVFNYQKYK